GEKIRISGNMQSCGAAGALETNVRGFSALLPAATATQVVSVTLLGPDL
uniref:Uncharacterized protein n=1 Tax=Varanus komodoensis TaxID=61221 RepID=A0A8D2L2D6_VARKO